jgi:hypothetical protein
MASTIAANARGRDTRIRFGSLRRSSTLMTVIHRKVRKPTAM